jgi:hypothetical protein
MTFNVNDFRSQLVGGGAKASLFQVQITNPIINAGDLKTPFMVQAAALPESTLGVIEVPYFGRKVKIAGDRTFAEWTVTIINDEDFLIRNAMENWMSTINTHIGNVRALGTSSPSEYKSQAQITQYSKTGAELRTYTFNGLFPSSVAPITMDWNTTDDIERFDVTFQYDWWEVTGGNTGRAGNV